MYEQDVLHSEAELPLFETAPDPFVITDLSGLILAMNGAARAINPGVVVGSTVETLFVTGDRLRLLLALRSLVQRTADHCDLRVDLADRDERAGAWVRAARTCWGAPPEPAVNWIVRELGAWDESRDQLANTAALKDAYLLALAHDLRTPGLLAPGMAELLQSLGRPGAGGHAERGARSVSAGDRPHHQRPPRRRAARARRLEVSASADQPPRPGGEVRRGERSSRGGRCSTCRRADRARGSRLCERSL